MNELELLRRGRPGVDPPNPEARSAAQDALRAAMARDGERRASGGLRRGWPRPAWLAPVAAVLVVVAVVAIFLSGHGRRPTHPVALNGPELVFAAQATGPTRQVKVGAVARAVSLLQQLVTRPIQVTREGERVVVHVPGALPLSDAELLPLIDTTGRFVFYDWEAVALTPGGRPVAELLSRQNPAALLISQGGGNVAPGSPGAGSLTLYHALRIAAAQPEQASPDNGRPWAEYFAFGAPSSAGCAAAARYYSVRIVPGQYCYLAGPTPSAAQVAAALPPGVSASEAQVLKVPRGTVVLQGVSTSSARQTRFSDPTAQFYALRDHVGLFGSATTKPTPSTDQAGSPDVVVGFTAKGAAAFQSLTAQIAHRGDLVSGLGQTFNQHVAVAVGDRLTTVPSIDFRTYPDGVPGQNGAVLTGGYTQRSARTMTLEMELGALPITLKLVSGSPRG